MIAQQASNKNGRSGTAKTKPVPKEAPDVFTDPAVESADTIGTQPDDNPVTIKLLKQKLQVKQEEIRALDQVLKDKEQETEHLSEDLDCKTQRIQQLEDLLAQKDVLLQQLDLTTAQPPQLAEKLRLAGLSIRSLVEDLNQKLDSRDGIIQKLELELQVANNQVKKLELPKGRIGLLSRNATDRRRLLELEKENEQLKKQLTKQQDAETQLRAQVRDLQRVKDQAKKVNGSLGQQQAEEAKSKQQVQKQLEKQRQLQQELDRLQGAVSEADTKLAQAQQQQAEEHHKMEEKVGVLTEELKEYQNLVVHLEGELCKRDSDVQNLDKRLEKMAATCKLLEEQYREASGKLLESEAVHQQREAYIADIVLKKDELLEQMRLLAVQRNEAHNRVHAATVERDEALWRLADWRHHQQQLELEAEEQRSPLSTCSSMLQDVDTGAALMKVMGEKVVMQERLQEALQEISHLNNILQQQEQPTPADSPPHVAQGHGNAEELEAGGAAGMGQQQDRQQGMAVQRPSDAPSDVVDAAAEAAPGAGADHPEQNKDTEVVASAQVPAADAPPMSPLAQSPAVSTSKKGGKSPAAGRQKCRSMSPLPVPRLHLPPVGAPSAGPLSDRPMQRGKGDLRCSGWLAHQFETLEAMQQQLKSNWPVGPSPRMRASDPTGASLGCKVEKVKPSGNATRPPSRLRNRSMTPPPAPTASPRNPPGASGPVRAASPSARSASTPKRFTTPSKSTARGVKQISTSSVGARAQPLSERTLNTTG